MTRMILLAMTLLIILAGMAFLLAPGTVRTVAGTALAQMREPALPQPKVAEPEQPTEPEIVAEPPEDTEAARMKLKKDRAPDRPRATPPTLIRKSREDDREEPRP